MGSLNNHNNNVFFFLSTCPRIHNVLIATHLTPKLIDKNQKNLHVSFHFGASSLGIDYPIGTIRRRRGRRRREDEKKKNHLQAKSRFRSLNITIERNLHDPPPKKKKQNKKTKTQVVHQNIDGFWGRTKRRLSTRTKFLISDF